MRCPASVALPSDERRCFPMRTRSRSTLTELLENSKLPDMAADVLRLIRRRLEAAQRRADAAAQRAELHRRAGATAHDPDYQRWAAETRQEVVRGVPTDQKIGAEEIRERKAALRHPA